MVHREKEEVTLEELAEEVNNLKRTVKALDDLVALVRGSRVAWRILLGVATILGAIVAAVSWAGSHVNIRW